MNIIFFSHPAYIGHQSMPRFTSMLAHGMEKRGHRVEVWAPEEKLMRLPVPPALKKWLGYIDQYVLFPITVRKRLRTITTNTLFVFIDQALGPWIPLVAGRPHLVHCHDFLAQFSAKGAIPEHHTKLPGRMYQAYIRKGFRKGKNFISVSEKTQADLHTFLPAGNVYSSVVYNGLNHSFEPFDTVQSRLMFGSKAGLDLTNGYLLHVGGNTWYKNKVGVIDIYDAWRTEYSSPLPLMLIGDQPTGKLVERHEESPFKSDIHFLSNIENDTIRFAYAGASLLLFPSYDEGFGWPIIEAMACGCPVITTNKAPMTTVAGTAGFFIARKPAQPPEVIEWANEAAAVMNKVLILSSAQRQQIVEEGFKNAKRFDTETALNKIEAIYEQVIATTVTL